MYFGEVQIPTAVFNELTINPRFEDEAKGRDAAEQMGIKIMGTIGLLMASYQNGNISADEIKNVLKFCGIPDGILEKNIFGCCWNG